MNLGKQLHKLGDMAFAHPWRVVAFWIVTLGILGAGAVYFMEPTSSSISIPGTKAQQAIDRAEELFPDSGGGSGRIVFHAKDAKINNYRAVINDVIADVEQIDGVNQVASPFISQSFVSDDGTIAYAQIQLEEQSGSISPATTEAVERVITSSASQQLQIELGGDIVMQVPGEILGIGEVVGVMIALVVLLMTLGSIIAAGMPIISALIAVGVSTLGLFALSRVIDINSTTPVLGIMLGLAVGIDYALFIINRYRSLVLAGYEHKQAAARALGTAGNAVVFAAFTVIIALAALSVVNIPFMTVMGLAGAASIAIAALAAITLVPALLGLAGPRILSHKLRLKAQKAQQSGPSKTDAVDQNSFWYKWGRKLTLRPVPVLLVAVLVVGAVAWPAKDLQLGLPTDQYASPSSTERQAYDLLSEGFGEGFSGPLVVVTEGLPEVSQAEEEAVRQLALQQAAALAQIDNDEQRQAALDQIERRAKQYAKFAQIQKVADEIGQLENVQQATPATVTDDGTAGIIQVIPSSSPASDATKQLIADLRDQQTQRQLVDSDKVTFGVTGSTALQEDINQKLAKALPVYLAVVIGLSLLLLIVAFRSILVPIKATLGFLLSVLAMFGAMVAVFQWGWFDITDAPGPIVSFVPIIAIGVLFGLAMDYEFFLVSGMHEAYGRTKDAKQAVLDGFGAGSKVVTAAAVIMISVFAGFITNHEAVIQSIGFGLAIGILIDAFVVRMTIVPAIMTLLGKSAWWLPKWLDKRLPHVSIEGESEPGT